MSKKEFLKNLEEALLEKMDISDAVEHIRYYNDYISNEVAKGKSEEDVISSLQSPRLIAKCIIKHMKIHMTIHMTIHMKTHITMLIIEHIQVGLVFLLTENQLME